MMAGMVRRGRRVRQVCKYADLLLSFTVICNLNTVKIVHRNLYKQNVYFFIFILF